jgi:hypothetical protein
VSAIANARPARRRDRLGERWATFKRLLPFPRGRAGRRGWVVATLTLAVAIAYLALSAAAGSTEVRFLVLEVGAVGWVLLALSVLWRPPLLTPALLVLAVPAVVLLVTHSDQKALVIALAPLLVATGELAGWSFDLRSVVAESAAVAARRLIDVAILTAGAAGVAGAVLAVSALPAPGGILPLVAGAGATLTVVALATVRRW